VTVFTVRLRATRSGNDGVRDLRRLLKYALRACRLRAISVREEAVERRKRAA
jgi:hypothetical protein